MTEANPFMRCIVCKEGDLEIVFQYDKQPEGETNFSLFEKRLYEREIWQCHLCGHFINLLDVDFHDLYTREYVNAVYGTENSLLATYEKIMKLPPLKSDNIGRVQRILSFMSPFHEPSDSRKEGKPLLLDIGSGLCVFPARMKEEGWNCTALDPDLRAVSHARQNVGIPAIEGDFMEVDDIGTYDLITFNKVLEHMKDPGTMLMKSRQHLRESGVVYVEVPDGEMAAKEGPEREEFFIEHHHVFSMTSICLLATSAGFSVRLSGRVHEPSSKYTLFAFLIDDRT